MERKQGPFYNLGNYSLVIWCRWTLKDRVVRADELRVETGVCLSVRAGAYVNSCVFFSQVTQPDIFNRYVFRVARWDPKSARYLMQRSVGFTSQS